MRAALRIGLVAVSAAFIAGPASADGVDRLLSAYPGQLAGREGNELVWKDGQRMTIDDGKAKSAEQLLAAPDIEDMFAYAYPSGMPNGAPADDPGRIRNEAFFKKMYGDCSKGGVSANLVSVPWLPQHKGGSLKITRINGVDQKLRLISQELDALPAETVKALVPSAGTYNCRAIAGTSNPSAHGYGIAIDLNSAYGNYWRWGKGGYQNRIPAEVVAIFEKHGFIWGGKWAHFDTFHFEYRPELLR